MPLVPLIAAISMRSSASKRSSTPHPKAASEPPPCSPTLIRLIPIAMRCSCILSSG
jgi:hypothetical protein